jgi:hypothetical protein
MIRSSNRTLLPGGGVLFWPIDVSRDRHNGMPNRRSLIQHAIGGNGTVQLFFIAADARTANRLLKGEVAESGSMSTVHVTVGRNATGRAVLQADHRLVAQTARNLGIAPDVLTELALDSAPYLWWEAWAGAQLLGENR